MRLLFKVNENWRMLTAYLHCIMQRPERFDHRVVLLDKINLAI